MANKNRITHITTEKGAFWGWWAYAYTADGNYHTGSGDTKNEAIGDAKRAAYNA